ncbi:hypothetical protein V6948_04030 [Fusobacterium varium]|uniref:hypothetical protein n=1 Tax=Fusobacterium varium TaxID=856 RepID=UPI002FF0CB6C
MEKQKIFFWINISFIGLLLGIIFLLSQFDMRFVNQDTVKFYELKKRNIKLKIINLGSSHTSYGIKYPSELEAWNLALPAQLYFSDYQILKQYLNKLNKKCIVIIPVSLFSFSNNIKDYPIDRYIYILNRKNFTEMSKKNLNNIEYFLKRNVPILFQGQRIISIIKYIYKSIKKGKFEKQFVEYPRTLTKLENKEKTEFSINAMLNGYDNSNSEVRTLIKILEYIESKEYIPVLITTPYTYFYNEKIGKNTFQRNIYDNIEYINKNFNKNFLYLDYSHDKRFENNFEYFRDSNHLNEKGAEYFTEILLEDLERNGLNF